MFSGRDVLHKVYNCVVSFGGDKLEIHGVDTFFILLLISLLNIVHVENAVVVTEFLHLLTNVLIIFFCMH